MYITYTHIRGTYLSLTVPFIFKGKHTGNTKHHDTQDTTTTTNNNNNHHRDDDEDDDDELSSIESSDTLYEYISFQSHCNDIGVEESISFSYPPIIREKEEEEGVTTTTTAAKKEEKDVVS